MEPFIPMSPVAEERIPTGSGWIHQLKWDGYRLIAQMAGDRVRLYSKRMLLQNDSYPELTAAFAGHPGGLHTRRRSGHPGSAHRKAQFPAHAAAGQADRRQADRSFGPASPRSIHFVRPAGGERRGPAAASLCRAKGAAACA
ncbi:hypothetical protein OMP40_27190 [Cohnella rhizosphaerae]|uniref:ATP-dependent DNA ligase family profile domain-containing protein n=1 Tax=Cohnella rhizosphaerae TaxID=1457232 RepID=A0A9X4QWQ6_9BACL|nr:hypothetical protein [Cohnella rhizosphaerae]MDG0812607.1 hypothetical protein [Cohnella rhizosphaerae]